MCLLEYSDLITLNKGKTFSWLTRSKHIKFVLSSLSFLEFISVCVWVNNSKFLRNYCSLKFPAIVMILTLLEWVQDPVVSPLCELDTDALQDLIPDIPLWVKSPDYDRVRISFHSILFAFFPFIWMNCLCCR